MSSKSTMDVNAAPFVPGGGGSPIAAGMGSRPSPPVVVASGRHADPAPPASAAAGVKLRATAVAFVPGGTSSAGGSPLVPPPPAAVVGSKIGGAPSASPPQSPSAASAVAADSRLSPNAAPYTPTKMVKSPATKGSSLAFPATVPPPATAGAAAAATAADTTATESAGASSASSAAPVAATAAAVELPPLVPPLAAFLERTRIPPGEAAATAAEGETAAAALDSKLHASWTLYADDHPPAIGGQAGAEGAYAPNVLHVLNDVEGLWRLLRSVPLPGACTANFTYSLFRSNVRPTWEDVKNKNGGSFWIVLWDKDKLGVQDRQVIDDAWVASIIALCGESLPDSAALVTGLVLKVRKSVCTLQYWVSSAQKTQLQPLADSIKRLMSQKCGRAVDALEFYTHAQLAPAAAAGGSAAAGGRSGGRAAPAKPVRPAAKKADFTC